jgi:hypothetical protein
MRRIRKYLVKKQYGARCASALARPEPNLRKNRINLRLNPSERAIIGLAAANIGITIPQFIRETIRGLIEELNASDSPDDCVKFLMEDAECKTLENPDRDATVVLNYLQKC